LNDHLLSDAAETMRADKLKCESTVLRQALEAIANHDCDGDRLGYKCDGCRTCIAINALEAINAR
jgi:hypothetical protein